MNKVIALLGIVVVGGALVVWKLIGKETDDNSTVTRKETPVMSSGDQPRSKDTDSKEAQGEEGRTVSARVSYNNPAGEDEVGVTLTLNKEGVIVATATEVLAAHEISKKRQESFASELTATLQGKKLSELTAIDRVGGSSLTTMAFNQALPQLKAQL
jgi:hypothetical protein